MILAVRICAKFHLHAKLKIHGRSALIRLACWIGLTCPVSWFWFEVMNRHVQNFSHLVVFNL
jgi:hypothetical protein